MNNAIRDADLVSTTLARLYFAVAKITSLAKPPLPLIGIAIVLARALESIAMLICAGERSGVSRQDSATNRVRAVSFAVTVRDELVDAISDLDRGLDPLDVAVLMERAISVIDLLVGDRAVIELDAADDSARAARILSLATEALGGAAAAAGWMCRHSGRFAGNRPLDLLTFREGARLVAIHLMQRMSA